MTANDMMTLRALLELWVKSSDADLLREMIGFTAERLMALEVNGLTGAAHGERSPERITHVDGCVEPRIFGEQADVMVAVVIMETIQGCGWVCGQSSACRSSMALW